MIILLSIVALLEFAFIVYQDVSFRAEREKLQLKLMSSDTIEYKQAVEKAPEETKDEKDPYVDLDEVPMDELLEAEDNL